MLLRSLLALLFLLPWKLVIGDEHQQISIVSASPQWQRLLHYQRGLDGKFKSRADGPGFFLSPLGRENPEEELKTSLRSFKDSATSAFHCSMPARAEFLSKTFKLPLPELPCPDLESYLKQINPHGLSMVFASNFAKSSASYFGHTFLRFHGKSPRKNADLLDYTFSYTAGLPDDASLLNLAVNGVFGGLKGVLEILPYYKKIHEYGHMEERDLWSYELDVSEEDAVFLAKHLWELNNNTDFDYFFLDENCAYFLLAVLEVIKPQWNLLDHFFIYVTPVESIKSLKKAGAIKKASVRPSIRSTLLRYEQSLNHEQTQRFKNIIRGVTRPADEKDPLVLETVLAYFAYRKFDEGMGLSRQEEDRYEQAMGQRSHLPALDEKWLAPISMDSAPELSHHTFNLGSSLGYAQGSNFVQGEAFAEFVFKPAVHDLLNNDIGFNANSQTDYLKFSLRYYTQTKRWDLDQFLLLGMTNLVPKTSSEHALSWALHSGVRTLKNICRQCKAAYVDVQVGWSWSFAQERLLAFSLPLLYLEASSRFAHFLRSGPGLNLGLIFHPVANYKLVAQATLRTDLMQSGNDDIFALLEFNQSYSLSPSFDMRLYLSRQDGAKSLSGNHQEAKLNFNHYF